MKNARQISIISNVDVGVPEFLMQNLIKPGMAIFLNLVLIFISQLLHTDRCAIFLY